MGTDIPLKADPTNAILLVRTLDILSIDWYYTLVPHLSVFSKTCEQ
jgi:hypothetical protein